MESKRWEVDIYGNGIETVGCNINGWIHPIELKDFQSEAFELQINGEFAGYFEDVSNAIKGYRLETGEGNITNLSKVEVIRINNHILRVYKHHTENWMLSDNGKIVFLHIPDRETILSLTADYRQQLIDSEIKELVGCSR